jgi:hypothetical protein
MADDSKENLRGPAKGAYEPRRGGGKLELQKSVVALMDILGFSKAVLEATDNGTATELLHQVDRFVGALLKALSDSNGDDEGRRTWEVRVFTDNMLISHPIQLQELGGDFEMGALLDQISHLQLGAISYGFFMRGALAVGEMFIDRNIIFGAPLVHAHEAESLLSNTPRILLTESAMDFVRSRVGPMPTAHSPYLRMVLRDEDGEPFINYLEASCPTSGEGPILDLIEEHRDAIVRAVKRFGNDPRIGPKYDWVARYHNFWCHSRGIEDYMLYGAGSLATRTLI